MVDEEDYAEDAPLLTDMERQEDADAGRSKNSASQTVRSRPGDDHPDAPIEVGQSGGGDGGGGGYRDDDDYDDDTLNDAPGNREQQEQRRQRRRELEIEDDDSSPSPSSQDYDGSRSKKRWRLNPNWVPYPVRRCWRAVARWSKGPEGARPYKIRPFFPKVQEFPLRLVDRFLPRRRHRVGAVFLYIALWIVTFALVKREETFATNIRGWGEPQEISCGTTFWRAGNRCGLDGVDCRPFNGSGFPFRCPANCRDYQVLNPRAVGDQEIVYRQLVIGGPGSALGGGGGGDQDDGDGDSRPIYRGDSHICNSAIHAGVVSNSDGGCGVVSLVGEGAGYAGSERNGIDSIAFDSYFPLSFTFEDEVECAARDMRWDLLGVSATYSGVLSMFTSSAPLCFFVNFAGIFWHVGLASDPPNHSSIAGLVSNVLGKFLPAMFVAWVMYDRMGVRRCLRGLTATVEKSVLWLGACWVGALTNYTLNFIPISRLTASDLQQQPGAKAALAIIIILLVVIVAFQVWFFRQEARLRKYLALYALFVLVILVCLTLPRLNLRLHHYVLALLLLPGTSMQTRPCLIYQGLLIGLFINGIARWGFDPVLETSAALQGDAPSMTPLPEILTPNITLGGSGSSGDSGSGGGNGSWSISFAWEDPDSLRYDGLSVLVNDVERFRTYFDDGMFAQDTFSWERQPDLDASEYFRFAFMEGSSPADYTKAGVWDAEGEWTEMEPGPSKLRARALGATEADEGVDRGILIKT